MIEEIKEKLWKYIDDKRYDIIKLCSDMVKIPSESPPGDMSELASLIRSWLQDRGLTVKAYEPKKGRINLVTKIGRIENPTLILNGHMDVVPAGNLKSWVFPPYCGEVKGGKILGRGTGLYYRFPIRGYNRITQLLKSLFLTQRLVTYFWSAR